MEKKIMYVSLIMWIVLMLNGCYTPKSHIIGRTTIRRPILFDENKNIVRTDGVYIDEDRCSKWADGMYYFFFPDGTFHAVYLKFPIFHGDTLDVNESLLKELSIKHMNSWKYYVWGVYQISGDTIIAEGFERGGLFFSEWEARSFQFKMQDTNCMTQFYGSWNYADGTYEDDVARNLVFIPASGIPSSDKYNYVMKEKLMWSDKKAWKAYMQKMKIEK